MKIREYEQIIESQMEYCVELLISKGKEYADNTDMLHNFKTAGELQGINPVKALAGMMAKHTVSIYDMCHSEGLFTIKQWEEKISDNINYLLILKTLLIDENMLLDDTKKEKSKIAGKRSEFCSIDEYAFPDHVRKTNPGLKHDDKLMADQQRKKFNEKMKVLHNKKPEDCSTNCMECAYETKCEGYDDIHGEDVRVSQKTIDQLKEDNFEKLATLHGMTKDEYIKLTGEYYESEKENLDVNINKGG